RSQRALVDRHQRRDGLLPHAPALESPRRLRPVRHGIHVQQSGRGRRAGADRGRDRQGQRRHGLIAARGCRVGLRRRVLASTKIARETVGFIPSQARDFESANPRLPKPTQCPTRLLSSSSLLLLSSSPPVLLSSSSPVLLSFSPPVLLHSYLMSFLTLK